MQAQSNFVSGAPSRVVRRELKHYTPPVCSDLPTQAELRSTEALRKFIDIVAPLETEQQRSRRELILRKLEGLLMSWVRELAVQKGVAHDAESASDINCQLLISGSYRLGINTPGGDIDCVCVAPRHVDRSDFFSSLLPRLSAHPDISLVNPIEQTKVSMIEVVFDEINIDLLFANVDFHTVRDDVFNILDDNVFVNVDEVSALSLNGPRVTERFFELVPNYETFKLVLRAVRLWGKKRGIYSNKMGYLGGVNFAILAAFTCQIYPNLPAAGVLLRFFHVLAEWHWPQPISLCPRYEDDNLMLDVWKEFNPYLRGGRSPDKMPVIAPAYPFGNTTYNVSSSSLAVMQREILRGRFVTNGIMRQQMEMKDKPVPATWAPLFIPSEFFLEFDYYIVIDIWTSHDEQEEELGKWQGYMEARIRKLVEHIENRNLPIEFIFNYPIPLEWDTQVDVQVPLDTEEENSKDTLKQATTSDNMDSNSDQQKPSTTDQLNENTDTELPEAAPKKDPLVHEPEATTTIKSEQSLTVINESSSASVEVGVKDTTETSHDAVEDDTDLLADQPVTTKTIQVDRKVVSFFVGFAPDQNRIHGATIDMRESIARFKKDVWDIWMRTASEPLEVYQLKERVLEWKNLPSDVFAPYDRSWADKLRLQIKTHHVKYGPSWRLVPAMRSSSGHAALWRRGATQAKDDAALDKSKLICESSSKTGSSGRVSLASGAIPGLGGTTNAIPGLQAPSVPGLSNVLSSDATKQTKLSEKSDDSVGIKRLRDTSQIHQQQPKRTMHAKSTGHATLDTASKLKLAARQALKIPISRPPSSIHLKAPHVQTRLLEE